MFVHVSMQCKNQHDFTIKRLHLLTQFAGLKMCSLQVPGRVNSPEGLTKRHNKADTIDRLRSSQLCFRGLLGQSDIRGLASSLSNLAECIPNVNALVELLFRSQPPETSLGCIPAPQLLEKLTIAKCVLRRQGAACRSRLWIEKLWMIVDNASVSLAFKEFLVQKRYVIS